MRAKSTSKFSELIASLLGILKAGGSYVPLDREYPASRLRLMVLDANLHMVITSGNLSCDPIAWGLTVLDLDFQLPTTFRIGWNSRRGYPAAGEQALLADVRRHGGQEPWKAGSNGNWRGASFPTSG